MHCSICHLMCKWIIDIESLQNRFLKVCYVPGTSAGIPRVSYFFSFFLLLRPLTVLMKQTRQAVCTIEQSVFLDVNEMNLQTNCCSCRWSDCRDWCNCCNDALSCGRVPQHETRTEKSWSQSLQNLPSSSMMKRANELERLSFLGSNFL